MRKRKPAYKRTTVKLPYDLWEELRIESVKKNIPLGDLITQKLKEWKALKEKTAVHPLDKSGLPDYTS